MVPTLTTKAGLDRIIEIERGLSVKNILLGAIPVCMQIKEHGIAPVAITLDLQIVRLAEAMNVKHNLKGPAIKTIVYDLLELYPNETLEDFMLVFKRMRQGYYGEAYHLLNEASIFGCVKLHLEEKWAEHERNLNHEKAERMKAESFTVSDEALMEAYGITKNEEGKLVYNVGTGSAVGVKAPEKKKKKFWGEDDPEYDEFRNREMAKAARKMLTVEGQKALLNQLDSDQTQSGIETTEPAGTDEAGAGK